MVTGLSQIGLLLLMFLVGLEIDPAHLPERGTTAMMVLMALATTLMTTPLLAWLWPTSGAAVEPAREVG